MIIIIFQSRLIFLKNNNFLFLCKSKMSHGASRLGDYGAMSVNKNTRLTKHMLLCGTRFFIFILSKKSKKIILTFKNQSTEYLNSTC